MRSSLNHPNIAAIYDLAETNGTRYLVLELVEGETLADRVARGPIPVEEALDIATHICKALEAAHENGIIHRDLKPANVKVTPDGNVKVLDFGLAKAVETALTDATLSGTPTVLSGTMDGILAGTAAYMSPEQARGKSVDRRADVWAFGCVLYEMLTGRKLFAGETASDSIAKVLERQPDWNEMPKGPPAIRTLLQRCLQKDLRKRLRDLGDVLIELEDIRESLLIPEPHTHSYALSTTARIALTAAILLAATAVLAGVYLRSAPPATETMYLSIAVPGGLMRGSDTGALDLAISPDGRFVAFTSVGTELTERDRKLWVRSLYRADPHVIEGSDGASSPFWAPDSRSVGFFANGKLLRADLQSGQPSVICLLESNSTSRASATWNRDGTILFGLDSGRTISRVSAKGGAVAPATTLNESREDFTHLRPHFLPDGRRFLFFVGSRNESKTGIYAGSLDSKDTKIILANVSTPAYYAPSGHLVFVKDSSLFAQRFDLSHLELLGEPIRIADSIIVWPGNVFAAFSVSETGVLAYRTGDLTNFWQSELTWFDRRGVRLEKVGDTTHYRNPRLSPDGGRVAVSIDEGTESALWILGPGNTSTRFTSPGGNPVWSVDGTRLFYTHRCCGDSRVLQRLSTGVGNEQEVYSSSEFLHIDDSSPDGKYLAISVRNRTTNRDVLAVSRDGKQKPILVAATRAQELYGRLSPDGHWITYVSDESGKPEVYAQAFPLGGSRMLLSRNGGEWPVWRRDGKELFYISLDRKKLMSVSMPEATPLRAATPQALFEINLTLSSGIGTSSHFDVSHDGQRFLINTAATKVPIPPIQLVLNWTQLLKP